MKKPILSAIATVLLLAGQSHAADQKLQEGDTLAICGDSITEQKLYSVDMEDYLLMCKPTMNVKSLNFGWGGETSWGFQNKMAVYTLPYKPTVATTCYGMNDGAYNVMNDDKARHYREAETAMIHDFKNAGVRFIVLGSPGAVDVDTYRKRPTSADIYNNTLAALGEIDKDLAQKEGLVYADVHGAMMDVMHKAKAKYGDKYVFAGPDGVHPGPNGHLVMAYAFLKALGVSGDVGTITVDMANNSATATDGHKILSDNNGAVEVESTKYPFCFYGDPKTSDATTGVIEFFPFNDDLNRFKLVVTGAKSEKLKVTWGDESKEFAAADLAKGINLAAEFLKNPFVEPFMNVDKVIRAKQDAETKCIKNTYDLCATIDQKEASIPATKDAAEKMINSIRDYVNANAAASLNLVQPVKHTIKIEAVS